MISSKLASKNCLFLICPTDQIESVLNKATNNKTYFYTSLGASFNWDIHTQQNLIRIIKNQKIDSLIFVTKSNNCFYKKTSGPINTSLFSINKRIVQAERTLPDRLLQQSHPVLKTMLFASRYLQNQRKNILETSILGKALKQKGVNTNILVYHPDNGLFYTTNIIEKKVLLYGKLSAN